MANVNTLENKLVVLIGGSGFLGTHIAQDLLGRGARLRVAARNPEKAFRLKPLANLGQIEFVRCDAGNRASIEACVQGADAVVYLVGTFAGDQQALQADGAGHAASVAAAGGAQAFVYVSAIGADPAKETGYYRTKGDGEQQVLRAFPQATVIRPSVVFGEDGGLVPMFAGLVQMMPVIPVFGAESQFQLVWVDDVATAVGNALANPGEHGGKTFTAAGPQKLTMMQINEMIAEGQQRKRTFFAMPGSLANLFARLPMTPINPDQLAMLGEGSVADPDLPGLAELGVKPSPLTLFLDRWMVSYRRNGRFTKDRTPA